jgi:hypothetical protein
MDNFGYEEPPPRQPMTKQYSNTSLDGGYSGSYGASYGGEASMSRSTSENFLNDTPRSTNSARGEDTFSEGESDMDRGM